VATSNRGKFAEIAEMLGDLNLDLFSLADIERIASTKEDRPTFMENAEKKALHYASCAKIWTIADDSGLEVDALGGDPGVRSARYAGSPSDDGANNRKLIENLVGFPPDQRTARFRCALVLADTDIVLIRTEGVVEGRIVDQPRGQNGFGYDPHFLIPELDRTAAELSPDEKNAVSHRGQAVRKLKKELYALLANGPISR
jgi:XTP/dITP diphosphohydrolase